MLSKFMSFITAVLIAFGSISTMFLPKVPAPASQEEPEQTCSFIKQKDPAENIYVIDAYNLPLDEADMLMCLQGIVAKTQPRVLLLIHGRGAEFLEAVRNSGRTVIDRDDNGNKWTSQTLITELMPYIGDAGYCLYRQTETGYGLNTAVNYATLYGWLPVSERLEPLAQACGLIKKADLCDRSDELSLEIDFFREHKNEFSKDAVVHMKNDRAALRDFAIEQGLFCFYTLADSAGLRFLKEVLSFTGFNTAVLGWVADEKKCVSEISSCGCFLVPSDICANNSIMAFIDNENLVQNVSEGVAADDESKHYVCLLYSDGDNCQWIQNGYGEYVKIRKSFPDIPVTWSFSPFMKYFCPTVYNSVVSSAVDGNQLAGGPSGLGYCNLSRFPAAALDSYSALSAAAMQSSGQRIMVSLDDYTTFKDSRMQYALSYFSRFDNIDGGLLFIDPTRYEGGRGKIWFCDDKPFVSVRLSLWCDGGYSSVTGDWVKEQADIINSYPADIHSVNGYSLVCVHAWTMESDWIETFVDSLDDDVVILNAADFIATIAQNVPHKNAVPDSSDKTPILK